MVKSTNTSAIEIATDTSWPDWCWHLDNIGAQNLDHNGIVKLARAYRPISGWWAQGVAVAYEQHIGRRLPGQTSDGLFSATLSRTPTGQVTDLHAKWASFAANLAEVGGLGIAGAPTLSTTPKRLYWRCKFTDNGLVSIGFEPKGDDKALIALEHRKLPDHGDIERMKQAWRALFATGFDA